MGKCIVFCAAEFDRLACPIEPEDYVIAADGGLQHTQALGIEPQEILGDFDSLGYIPQEKVKSWFLAWRHHPAVRFRRNLIAVEIGPQSTSMQPTLNPGDIVLVDRDERDVQRPGHMMLVTDPDGGGMVKRVSIEDRGNGDYRITFYSDNAALHPPLVYSLREDYAGDWDKVIAGRVIWAWTDMREK